MAKKYMGEGDPVLDALYEELDETGRKTRADRRKRRQLEREIRKIRAGRLGGIKGLFKNLLQRKYPVPASATAAASTLGLGEAFAPTLGTAISEAVAEVPQTVAVPELEEIEVTGERKPEMIEAKPKRGDLTRRSQFPFGIYTGEYAEQFGNEPVQDMLSKLGSNQLKTLERRRRKMAQWPDAFPEDYATPEGLYKYAHGGTLTGQADTLSRAGRGDDTMLMHVTPEEVQGLASLAPGMMTINPETGLPEAGWFKNLLGFAAPFLMSMIPGVGPVLGGALGGGLGSLIKGGDIKDALLGAGLGALGGKMFGGASEVGADVLAGEAATGALATPEAFGQAMQGVGPEGLTDIATQAGITPNQLSVLSAPATTGLTPNLPGITMPTGTITSAIQSGVNPSIALSQAGVSPEQLGVFKEGLSGVAREALPDTFAQNLKNIGAGGLGGLKSAMFTPAGLGYITGTGLTAQHESQQAYEDYLLAMEEQRKQRERDIEAYYPENIPYAGGGSIYKDRYINGNWS